MLDFETYYDKESGEMDWKRVEKDGDRTLSDAYDFWAGSEWREQQALLDQECAKACREVSGRAQWVPRLSFDEECVLTAVGTGQKRTKELALECQGDMSDTGFKTLLSQMKGRGLLEHDRKIGYTKGPMVDLALRRAAG